MKSKLLIRKQNGLLMTNVPLPKLRDDIIIEYFSEEGNDFVAYSDENGVAPQPVVIPRVVGDFVQLLDGKLSIEDIRKSCAQIMGEGFDSGSLESVIMQLEARGFMDSARTRIALEHINQYLHSNQRPTICHGTSYPEDVQELKKYLDEILSAQKLEALPKTGSVLAPHIDFRIGEEAHKCYSLAFEHLDREADLAIIFGTSHNRVSADFMLTKKHYISPLGELETDLELIAELEKELGDELHFDDLAHRTEHSIEFHALLLQYIFAGKIKILPILTGGMSEYLASGEPPKSDSKFMNFIKSLKSIIEESGKKVILLASGDLAHIGRRFGDDFDAESQFDKLSKEDTLLVKMLESADGEAFFKALSQNKNYRNICGLAPFYSVLSLLDLDSHNSVKSSYGLWNDKETLSAVSFVSVAFEKV